MPFLLEPPGELGPQCGEQWLNSASAEDLYLGPKLGAVCAQSWEKSGAFALQRLSFVVFSTLDLKIFLKIIYD